MKPRRIRLRKRLQKQADAGATIFGALKSPGSHLRDVEAAKIRLWLDEDEAAHRTAAEVEEAREAEAHLRQAREEIGEQIRVEMYGNDRW